MTTTRSEAPETGPERSTALAVRPGSVDLTRKDVRDGIVARMKAERELVSEVMKGLMKPEIHYGTIPGTLKPSLYQPGAELIAKTLHYQVFLEKVGEFEDWAGAVFAYTYRCRVLEEDGTPRMEWEATCSTEETRYAEQHVQRTNRAGRELRVIPAADQREVVMQMAQKRAYVAAVRHASAASDMFTQDEEITDEGEGGDESTRTSAKDKGFGVCPTHGVPYSQSEKQRESGFPPSHRKREGGYCEKRAEEPREAAPSPVPLTSPSGIKPVAATRPTPIPTGTERARLAIEKLIDGEVGSKAWLDARSKWITERFPELVKKGWAYWSDEDWSAIAATAEAEQAKRVEESWGAMAPQAPAAGGTT